MEIMHIMNVFDYCLTIDDIVRKIRLHDKSYINLAWRSVINRGVLDQELFDWFMANGINVHEQYSFRSLLINCDAFHASCENRFYDQTKLLLDNCIDLSLDGSREWLVKNSYNVITTTISGRFENDHLNKTAVPIVQMLLDYGAEPKIMQGPLFINEQEIAELYQTDQLYRDLIDGNIERVSPPLTKAAR